MAEVYICPECRNVVYELPCRSHRIREDFGIGRFTVALAYEEAPCECGTRFVDAYPCECCDEYFPESELDEYGLCSKCREEEMIA